jgi:hypothetical protein
MFYFASEVSGRTKCYAILKEVSIHEGAESLNKGTGAFSRHETETEPSDHRGTENLSGETVPTLCNGMENYADAPGDLNVRALQRSCTVYERSEGNEGRADETVTDIQGNIVTRAQNSARQA